MPTVTRHGHTVLSRTTCTTILPSSRLPSPLARIVIYHQPRQLSRARRTSHYDNTHVRGGLIHRSIRKTSSKTEEVCATGARESSPPTTRIPHSTECTAQGSLCTNSHQLRPRISQFWPVWSSMPFKACLPAVGFGCSHGRHKYHVCRMEWNIVRTFLVLRNSAVHLDPDRWHALMSMNRLFAALVGPPASNVDWADAVKRFDLVALGIRAAAVGSKGAENWTRRTVTFGVSCGLGRPVRAARVLRVSLPLMRMFAASQKSEAAART